MEIESGIWLFPRPGSSKMELPAKRAPSHIERISSQGPIHTVPKTKKVSGREAPGFRQPAQEQGWCSAESRGKSNTSSPDERPNRPNRKVWPSQRAKKVATT